MMTATPAGPTPFPPIRLLHERGVRLFSGSDGIRDTWSPLNNGDMLERAMFIGLRHNLRRDDEIALALRSDVWQRSFRARVVTTRPGRAPVRSRHGLTILPDAEPRAGRYLIPGDAGPAAPQLDQALAAMGRRYGPFAVRLAKLGLEYDPAT